MPRHLQKLVWIAVLPVSVCLAQDALSQPAPVSPRFPAEQPVALAARVALLEQRVHAIDARLKAFDKVALHAKPDGSYRLVANGASVVIARDGTVSIAPPPAPSKAALPVEDPCDPPFSVDASGRRSIKPECLEVAPCDPPYSVDAQGRRSPKKECL
jgi:hypothetical protein